MSDANDQIIYSTEGLIALLEELNEPCECEQPTSYTRCYDSECELPRPHNHAFRVCVDYELCRWWRLTTKPWHAPTPSSGGLLASLGPEGMAILRRVLTAGERTHATLERCFKAIKQSVLDQTKGRCAVCRVGRARYLAKNPAPGYLFGGVCLSCKHRRPFDIITWEWIGSGDADLASIAV